MLNKLSSITQFQWIYFGSEIMFYSTRIVAQVLEKNPEDLPKQGETYVCFSRGDLILVYFLQFDNL